MGQIIQVTNIPLHLKDTSVFVGQIGKIESTRLSIRGDNEYLVKLEGKSWPVTLGQNYIEPLT